MKNLNVVFDISIRSSMCTCLIGEEMFVLNGCLFVCRQGAWTREDFHRFLNALFSNKQRPYCILSDLVEQYFRETDFNQDEKIDFDEFLQAWKKPVKCVNDVIPMFCLILYAVVSRLLNLSAH